MKNVDKLIALYSFLSEHDADCYPRPDLWEGACDCGASEMRKLRDEWLRGRGLHPHGVS